MPRFPIALTMLFSLLLMATSAMAQVPNLETRLAPVDAQSQMLTNETEINCHTA